MKFALLLICSLTSFHHNHNGEQHTNVVMMLTESKQISSSFIPTLTPLSFTNVSPSPLQPQHQVGGYDRTYRSDKIFESIMAVYSTSGEGIDLTAYDFSSKQGWDDFYQHKNKQQQHQQKEIDSENSKINDNQINDQGVIHLDDDEAVSSSSSVVPFQFEWHSSLETSTILSMMPDIFTDIDHDYNILLPGNGNSNLPKLIHDHWEGMNTENKNMSNKNINITCMDYSQPCIDMLSMLYDKEHYSNMHFICGDAADLKNCIEKYYYDTKNNVIGSDDDNNKEINSNTSKSGKTYSYDMIVDKGLMDAIMCDEGWNVFLEKYFDGVSSLLKNDGKVILVSYKLSTSTKEFLIDMGEKFGIDWEFDMADKSNDRVSFSVGTKL